MGPDTRVAPESQVSVLRRPARVSHTHTIPGELRAPEGGDRKLAPLPQRSRTVQASALPWGRVGSAAARWGAWEEPHVLAAARGELVPRERQALGLPFLPPRALGVPGCARACLHTCTCLQTPRVSSWGWEGGVGWGRRYSPQGVIWPGDPSSPLRTQMPIENMLAQCPPGARRVMRPCWWCLCPGRGRCQESHLQPVPPGAAGLEGSAGAAGMGGQWQGVLSCRFIHLGPKQSSECWTYCRQAGTGMVNAGPCREGSGALAGREASGGCPLNTGTCMARHLHRSVACFWFDMNYTPPLQIVWKEYGCKKTAQSPVTAPAKHAWRIPACAEHLVGACVKVWNIPVAVSVLRTICVASFVN